MRLGGGIVPALFHDSMNLKRYCVASNVGEDPMLSASETVGLVTFVDIGGGRDTLVLATAVSRRSASRSSLSPMLAVDEKILPKIDHVFFVLPTGSGLGSKGAIESKSVGGAPDISCLGEVGNESKPAINPDCKVGASVLTIMNRLPGVGNEGAVDGGSFPLRSSSCLSQR